MPAPMRTAPPAVLARNFDPSAVHLDEALGESETKAETAALFPCGEKNVRRWIVRRAEWP